MVTRIGPVMDSEAKTELRCVCARASALRLLARRGELKEDPVVFAVTAPVSLLVGLLVTGLAIVAAAPWVVSG